jgi:ABC-type Co2+ transport system permease subunit
MSLPEGLKFLHAGWWVIHVLMVLLVYAYAYRKGRADERRAPHAAAAERPGS